jgi:plasmid stabilization system protein ParE
VIIYAPDAELDVERLHQRFVSHSKAAADVFMARLAKAEVRIDARPLTYRLLNDRETRRYSFRISRVSYLVDYRIEPGQIVVLRVWHGRQNRPT